MKVAAFVVSLLINGVGTGVLHSSDDEDLVEIVLPLQGRNTRGKRVSSAKRGPA